MEDKAIIVAVAATISVAIIGIALIALFAASAAPIAIPIIVGSAAVSIGIGLFIKYNQYKNEINNEHKKANHFEDKQPSSPDELQKQLLDSPRRKSFSEGVTSPAKNHQDSARSRSNSEPPILGK